MMKNTVVRGGVAALATSALLFTAVGCSVPGTSDGGGGGDTVKLGVLAPITGAASADGVQMKQGAELIVDELNKAGGVAGKQLELAVYDTKDQSPDAVAAGATSLTSDEDVVAAFTAYASTTNFEIDTFAEAGVPYILGGNSAQTQEIVEKDPDAYPLTWSVAPNYDGYNTDLPARLDAWDEDGTFPLRNRVAYIVSSDNPYSNGIAAGLTENLTDRGWEVVGPEVVPFGEIDDWNAQLGKIRQADPSLVINLDYQIANAAKFITQFNQNPTDSLVFIQYAPSVPEFLDLAGSDAEGLLFNLAISPLPGVELSDSIMEKYQDRFGEEAGLSAVAVYEQIRLWAELAEKNGDPSDKEAIGKAFGELDVPIAFGHLKFDHDTHLAMAGDEYIPTVTFQVQDGKRLLITPENIAQADFKVPAWIK